MLTLLLVISLNTTSVLPYTCTENCYQQPITAEFKALLSIGDVSYDVPENHKIAQECAANDSACIQKHDLNVLDAALLFNKQDICNSSTTPFKCREDFINGIINEINGIAVKKHNNILSNPCIWVGYINSDIVILLDPKTGETKTVLNTGNFKTNTYIGKCEK